MKQVCVVTWFSSWNFGTQLQATSLCKYFEEQGYRTYILKRFAVKSYFAKHPRLLISRVRRRLEKKKIDAFFHKNPYEVTKERRARLDAYIKDTFHVLSIDSTEKWNKIIRSNMIFVSGSDIIWQPAFGAPGMYFLDFAMYEKNLVRFSYASSTGAKTMPSTYEKDYKRLLSGFKAISTREQNSADYFSKLLGRPVTKVIDPTLLHDTDFWDQFAAKAELSVKPQKKYILCYFVMGEQRYWDYVRLAMETCGNEYEVVVLPMSYVDEQSGNTVIPDGTVYEFISLIKNAEFILTDSFHASVFSFLYQKEFYVMKRARSDEDEKYKDLMQRYGLSDRMIQDETVFVRKPDPDYSAGKAKLEEDRQRAFEYLSNALS